MPYIAMCADNENWTFDEFACSSFDVCRRAVQMRSATISIVLACILCFAVGAHAQSSRYSNPMPIDQKFMHAHEGIPPNFQKPIFTRDGAVMCNSKVQLMMLISAVNAGKSVGEGSPGGSVDFGCGPVDDGTPVSVLHTETELVLVTMHFLDADGRPNPMLDVEAWTIPAMLRN